MLQKILVPLDGSEFAECVIPYVEELCQRCDPVEIVLMQVIRTPPGRPIAPEITRPVIYEYPVTNLLEPPPEISASLRQIYRGQELASARARAEASLLPVAKRFCDSGAKTRIAVAFGRPAEQILEFAEREEMDLIAMSTHGRSGLSRWVFGSVAEKLLRGTHLPILLVRPIGVDAPALPPQPEVRL